MTKKEDNAIPEVDVFEAFAARGVRAQGAIDRLMSHPPATSPRERLGQRFAILRLELELALALFLLEHPAARPTETNIVELLAWITAKGRSLL